jgi:hypothetical protein
VVLASRQKKRQKQSAFERVLEELPGQIALMESQYEQLWLACVTPPPLAIAEEADRLHAENYCLRLQLFELIARVSPEVTEMIRQQQFPPPPPWQENEQLVMMGMMAVPPMGQQHLLWQQNGLQHPEVAVRAAGIGEGFHQHHQAPPPFQPVPPPVLDPIAIPQPHAVIQAHTGVYLQVSPGSDSQQPFSHTQSSPASQQPPPAHHHF